MGINGHQNKRFKKTTTTNKNLILTKKSKLLFLQKKIISRC